MQPIEIATNPNPTTWNDASFSEAKLICDSVNDDDVTLPQIRQHFDLMVDRWFSDMRALATKDSSTLITNDWQKLGALTLQWGFNSFYLVTLNTLHDTLVSKQRDYGHENIARFGRQGLLIRVHDKVARLENLAKKTGTPSNESIQDTVMDIAGYSTIGMMWERGTFLLPLE